MGRYAGSGRATVEESRVLDVRRWRRDGLLRPGHRFSWQWSINDEVTASIVVHVDNTAVVLKYRSRSYGEDWQDVEQRVPLAWTPCHFGGSRPWFRCDVYANGVHCGRRVAKLYGSGKLFACRHCYGLRYASQREHWGDRALRKAQKIRERLGASLSLADFAGKPKGMHWRTYERLMVELKAAEGTTNSYVLDWLSRLQAR